ncbi:ATP-dependent DNA helicase II subunit 1 [Orobanche gracilis]
MIATSSCSSNVSRLRAKYRSALKIQPSRSSPMKVGSSRRQESKIPDPPRVPEIDEIVSTSGQVEPPGMHMIYLPYSDDVRPIEELHTDINPLALRATEDQIKSATSLVKCVDLKNFSVCQFANPALQRHYAVLQALALDEDEMPDIKDETLPDEEGLARPGIVKALEDFKLSVHGENMEQEDGLMDSGKTSQATKKRKAIADNARKEYANYDWSDLADNGKLKELTVAELKYYLAVQNLPVTGKKEALISRILTHMGK